MDPRELNKYRYITETPTWWVRLMYFMGILAWLPIVFFTIESYGKDSFFNYFVTPIIVLLTLHYLPSFFLALFYKQFNLRAHQYFVNGYWGVNEQPSVDVYLPICGEGLDVLQNTWFHVSRLEYRNYKVYILDDSKEGCEDHRKLAEKFGFTYIERPNKGEMKKAGNLKYAFTRTNGSIIAILDADFAPHPEYLLEFVPYVGLERTGIVQSPQYFPTTEETHEKWPLSYGGARAQEIFYRIIQVARDRLGGTHCCGTCALYNREALESIGGFVQMGHSEDAHTGFGLTSAGWRIRYVPIIASVGASPNDAHAFFHQQHRWCMGNLIMMLSGKFWKAKIPFRVKFCYITGYLFYLHQPFLLLQPFQLFWILFYYNTSLNLLDGMPYYPHIAWALVYMFTFYIAPFRWGYLYALLMRTFAYAHAAVTVFLGRSVGWIPTNAKHVGISSAFRQTYWAVAVFFITNLFLVAFSIRKNHFQLFEPNFLTVQFWVMYNVVLIGMLLWQLYRTVERAQRRQSETALIENPFSYSLAKWQYKTVITFTMLVSVIFFFVAYLYDV